MPGKASKYSAATNARLEVAALSALNESRQALSTDQIIAYDPLSFSGITPQKMSRVLGKLGEMGFVQKAKSKSTGRMVYKATSVMEEQGYDVSM